jgi:histidinol-phosphate aminotransferase
VTNALRQTQVPFAVTTVAQQAALGSLEAAAEKELLERVDALVAERSRVYAALTGLGYDIPPTQGNFVWFPLGDAAVQWAGGCEERGVIVRAFAGHGVRVTIGASDENDRLIAAARDLR